ncbi:MAG TPA: DUF5655 domain-containing protein [Anaerolineales bacterium]|nr:DUF5655 domain-containing protein [Anaerolineales bacterium]
MTIIGNGKRYIEHKFSSEKEFEDEVVEVSNILFGKDTIYINAKKKIESKSLGGTIPDGFFFDFTDKTDPQFYVVEVEVTHHSFYNHIFPQITKFFAFFKNTKLRKELVDKLYTIVDRDDSIKESFQSLIGRKEIYKFLSDIIDSNQNILLIADGPIRQLPEISDTYTDTWGKLVKFVELRKYTFNKDVIYTITPDFETIQYVEQAGFIDDNDETIEEDQISEEYHLEGVDKIVKDIYEKLKQITLEIDSSAVFNPQKYYISIKAPKNIAFMKIRNKKIRLVVMMPEERIRSLAKYYTVAPLSKGVQDFYNGPCAAIDINSLSHEDELKIIISSLINFHRNNEKGLSDE